jgi:hypothetical protein
MPLKTEYVNFARWHRLEEHEKALGIRHVKKRKYGRFFKLVAKYMKKRSDVSVLHSRFSHPSRPSCPSCPRLLWVLWCRAARRSDRRKRYIMFSLRESDRASEARPPSHHGSSEASITPRVDLKNPCTSPCRGIAQSSSGTTSWSGARSEHASSCNSARQMPSASRTPNKSKCRRTHAGLPAGRQSPMLPFACATCALLD